MKKERIGFAFCGSFCTHKKVLEQYLLLTQEYETVIPIVSESAASTDTRFGSAADFLKTVETAAGRSAIRCFRDAEPIGPKKLLDALVIAPCTGNTLAKLSGGVAVIKVGAATETEMKEMKLRIEDALAATKAAVEEGIVAGGGTSYIDVIPTVAALLEKTEGDEKTGVQIVLKALEEPAWQIAKNAGLEGSVIVDKVKSCETGKGFNALVEEYVDMISAGIVDPVKVTRSALQNAASVASMVLTTESLVTDLPEPAAPAAPMDPGMGMY